MKRRNWIVLAVAAVCAAGVVGARAQSARDILDAAGVKGGLIVHVGCGDGKLTAELGAGEQFLVHGLTTDAAELAEARKNILAAGRYGRVSVEHFTGEALPYAENLVNLVFSEDLGRTPMSEVMRVLAPRGVAWVGGKKTVKPWPSQMSEWTHYLNGPENNAVAADPAIGPPRSLRWSGPPRWGRTHEELASMSAMVTAAGRLFYIVDDAPLISLWYPAEWKLVACDAFNGVKLWEKPIARWNDHLRHFRSGPAHLPRRLVAVGDDVFVTLGFDAAVTRLDAATGEVRNTYKGTERTEEIVCHDGVLYLMVGTSEAARSGEGLSQRGEPKPTATRFLIALDVESGKQLWRKNAKAGEFILPLSVTAFEDKVFYQDVSGIACVDARTGARKWLAKRPTPSKRYGWSTSTLVITEDVVLCADRKSADRGGDKVPPAKTDPSWGVTCFNVPSVSRKGANTLIAYAMADGRELWSAACGEGYNSPVDVFAVDSTVWLGPGFSQGYDIKTGEVRKKFSTKAQEVGMVHHRCYRNKASANYIFTGRDGIELIDLKKGWVGNNSWVRGTCQYGILPANGMLYAPPDACGCHRKARLQGFNALSTELPASAKGKPVSEAGRLVKGPAYGKTPAGASAGGEAWPMYRGDALRSGSTTATVPGAVNRKWSTQIGGRLTQPVSSGGKVFVASIDSHQLHALSAADGGKVWSHTAGGRIDSAPTLHAGTVVFGSADGWVTCLDQRDGQLVWRFHAAPEARLIANHGRLESSWPVHGSVLLHNGELVFTAGRSSYLDGGIYLYRLNPTTGKMLACSVISHIDPVTGKQTAAEKRGTFDSEGTISDILSSEGDSIFLKHMCFDASGKEVRDTRPHLFSATGLLGEEWFIRAYWLYGTNTGAGYGRWASMKSGDLSKVPAGRILSFDGQRIYGYGRIQHSGGWTGHRGDSYHLFSSVKVYAKAPSPAAARRGAKPAKPSAGAKTFTWSQKFPMIVRSMVLTADKLIVAGLPDAARKDESGRSFSNPDEGLAALAGQRGGSMAMISTADGTKIREIKLDSPPVFDGMSATEGKVFLSLRNGSVTCYAAGQP